MAAVWIETPRSITSRNKDWICEIYYCKLQRNHLTEYHMATCKRQNDKYVCEMTTPCCFVIGGLSSLADREGVRVVPASITRPCAAPPTVLNATPVLSLPPPAISAHPGTPATVTRASEEGYGREQRHTQTPSTVSCACDGGDGIKRVVNSQGVTRGRGVYITPAAGTAPCRENPWVNDVTREYSGWSGGPAVTRGRLLSRSAADGRRAAVNRQGYNTGGVTRGADRGVTPGSVTRTRARAITWIQDTQPSSTNRDHPQIQESGRGEWTGPRDVPQSCHTVTTSGGTPHHAVKHTDESGSVLRVLASLSRGRDQRQQQDHGVLDLSHLEALKSRRLLILQGYIVHLAMDRRRRFGIISSPGPVVRKLSWTLLHFARKASSDRRMDKQPRQHGFVPSNGQCFIMFISRLSLDIYSATQRQTAVTAHLKSKPILLFAFALQ